MIAYPTREEVSERRWIMKEKEIDLSELVELEEDISPASGIGCGVSC